MFCREHAVQFHRDRQKFADAGVNLVAIGHGDRDMATEFKRSMKVDLRVLVDPERRAYELAGAKRATLGELFGPGVVARGIRSALRSGVVQTLTKGNAAQLGGVLVVDTDGTVTWSHIAEDASDNPANEEVLVAARAAAANG